MTFIRLTDGTKHYYELPFIPNIEFIAKTLSNINRFNGTVGCYSVAQHCVLVASRLPNEYKFDGLLHDASEAYIGDVSSPLKSIMPEFKRIEDWHHDVIDEYFNVKVRCVEVTMADLRMLVTEAKKFGVYCDGEGYPDVERYIMKFDKWSADKAEMMFLGLFQELTRNISR